MSSFVSFCTQYCHGTVVVVVVKQTFGSLQHGKYGLPHGTAREAHRPLARSLTRRSIGRHAPLHPAGLAQPCRQTSYNSARLCPSYATYRNGCPLVVFVITEYIGTLICIKQGTPPPPLWPPRPTRAHKIALSPRESVVGDQLTEEV